MVDAQNFVSAKAYQLSNYANAVVSGTIPDNEVKLYCWDTIEEWSQLSPVAPIQMSPQENAFWYLLHQITFWNSREIRTSPLLKDEVDLCINYLRGKGQYPTFCSGVRP